jgi:DNA-binding MarR family transcriptional regulator
MSTLLSEIKQSRPFPSPGLETGVALLRTAVQLKRKLEKEMSAHGLTLQQFNVLRILRGAGEALPTMEIADRMVEPEPGITRLLGRIEQKGLITRTQCKEDRRRVLAEITHEGAERLDQIGEPSDYLVEGDTPLSKAELDSLMTLLAKVRHTLE